MKKHLLLLLTLFCIQQSSQATFSIVAVDPETGEVGNAGATCLEDGASIISGLVPGIGAMTSQSLVCTPENINLVNGLAWIEEGFMPQEILDKLYVGDECGADDHEFRQYGIALFDANGSPLSASFTGNKADSYANHIVGENYAIQGNILIGEEVLTGIEQGFLSTEGTLAEKLMGALQGANIAGADSRCLDNGTSSAGAFLRVACPLEAENCQAINLDVFYLDAGVEPIDTLQALFTDYQNNPPTEIPDNDECTKAIVIDVSPNENSCNATLAKFRGANESFVPITGCDKDNVISDVWYSFSTTNTIPEKGIVLKADLVNNQAVNAIGFAVYKDCKSASSTVACLSTADEKDSLLLSPICLAPETKYLVKVWVLGSHWNENIGVNFCVYEADPNLGLDVVWGKEEGQGDFNFGLNDWTTSGLSTPEHVWKWIPEGVFSSVISGFVNGETVCNGAVGINAAHYQTDGLIANFPTTPPPYPKISGELVSPVIDLSNIKSPRIQFTQHFAGLNGNAGSNLGHPNTNRGALVAYSINGGDTWSIPIPINDNIASNTFTGNANIKNFPLNAIAEQANVRLKFIWDGDYYFWLIDDVKVLGEIVEPVGIVSNTKLPNMQLQNNPVRDEVTIHFPNTTFANLQLTIFDVYGKSLFTKKTTSSYTQKIPVQNLPTGIYLLEANFGKQGKRVVKFVKE